MDRRTLKPVTAHIGGIDVTVHARARRRIRRAARCVAVAAGYAAGMTAAVCTAVAVAGSALVWPVLVCGGVAAWVAWRCRK